MAELLSNSIENSIIEEPKSARNDKYGHLRELKALLDDGVITTDEFDAEKAKILAD